MKKKTIVISEDLHQKIKIFCVENKLKLNDWIEIQLKKIIEKSDHK